SGVHRDAFANIAISADDKSRRTAAIFHRLRRRAERRERIDDRAWSNGGVAGDTDVSDKSTTVTDCHMRTDDTIRPDRNIISDHGSGLDPPRGIDHERAHASVNIAPTSASATSSPATFASPRYHHMFFRRVILFM